MKFVFHAWHTGAILQSKLLWNRLDAKNIQFSTFNTAAKDVHKYVQQSGGMQENLEKTIKSFSGTRPW